MDKNATAKTNSGENAKHSQNRRRRATIFYFFEKRIYNPEFDTCEIKKWLQTQ